VGLVRGERIADARRNAHRLYHGIPLAGPVMGAALRWPLGTPLVENRAVRCRSMCRNLRNCASMACTGVDSGGI
jgi:hypothetical protein